MKKLLILILAISTMIFAVACGQSEPQTEEPEATEVESVEEQAEVAGEPEGPSAISLEGTKYQQVLTETEEGEQAVEPGTFVYTFMEDGKCEHYANAIQGEQTSTWDYQVDGNTVNIMENGEVIITMTIEDGKLVEEEQEPFYFKAVYEKVE